MTPMYHLGYYGPVYLFLLAGVVWLAQHPAHIIEGLVAYLTFQLMVHFVNKLLKMLFKQKRPVETTADLLDGADRYGMPSGHAQMIFSQAALIVLIALRKPTYLYQVTAGIALLWAMITGWQRVDDQRHSLAQVVIGAVVGIACAALFVAYGLQAQPFYI